MQRIAVLLPLWFFLLFWEWAVAGDTQLQFLFAAPSLVGAVAMEELFAMPIWVHVGTTALETLTGLLAGTLLGTALGLLFWSNRRLDWLSRPYMIAIGSLPVFALAPMLIIWFGTGLLSKAVMAGFAVMFVAMIQAYEGAHAAAVRFADLPRALGAPQLRMIRLIIIPAAWQWVLTGFKVNVGLALVGAFIGEFVSAEAGLGYYILKSGSLYDTPRVIFGLLLMSLLALALTSVADRLRK
ncbi:MAG: ABC transporter permease [Bdellovibrionales bacterium]